MKKFRSWSSKRLTRSKTRKQEEALHQRAMDNKSNETPKTGPRVVSVFINDFADPDNHAAFLIWVKLLAKYPGLVKGIYIAEPRHVHLGYYVTSKETGECMGLLSRLEPKLQDLPISIYLGGWLTAEEIKTLRTKDGELTQEQAELLEICIKPEEPTGDAVKVYKEDAAKHAHLLAMDFLSSVPSDVKHIKFDTYVDRKCLSDDEFKTSISLKTHAHEELFFRSKAELSAFKAIIEKSEDIDARAAEQRDWYDKALDRKLKDFGGVEPWKDLTDYTELFKELNTYDRVLVFGGCSLTILGRILKSEEDSDSQADSLSKKIEYFQQGGTFDSAINILGNPLNFTLNPNAANYVFANAHRLGAFKLIPTDTTKMLKFNVGDLTKWSPSVGLHALGFASRKDIWNLIAPEESEDADTNTGSVIKARSQQVFDNPAYEGSKLDGFQADLLAYLLAFTDVFQGYQTTGGALSTSEEDVDMTQPLVKGKPQMILKMKSPESTSAIRVLMLTGDWKLSDAPVLQDTENLVDQAMNMGFKAEFGLALPPTKSS